MPGPVNTGMGDHGGHTTLVCLSAT